MKLSDLVVKANGTLVQGDPETEIVRAANIEIAHPGEIAFVANPRYEKFIATTKASAIIINELTPCLRTDIAVVRTRDPYVSFVKVLYAFAPKKHLQDSGIHPTAVVPQSVHLGKNVSIGPYVILSERVHVGNNTIILPNVTIGNDVRIGNDVTLYPNVVIREECIIGNRVVIESGTVVGSDGFGYAQREDGSYEKIPQLGHVVIEDDVNIGALCTIDRATMGETKICRGAKLDNLIQIAHNVTIGEHTVIAAQAGVSGSTKLGSHNMVGGQAGFTGHIETVSHVVLGAQSGVSKSIMKAGTYFGYPARDLRDALKHEATLRKLPELLNRVKELEEELKKMTEK